MEKIVFIAALAGQNTSAKWLTVDSDGAAKIVLEADAQQLEKVLKLTPLTKTNLRVTIEAE